MAKELQYRSRAAFKLIEILEKFCIIKTIKNGEVILDLGAAPGGWSQVISEKLRQVSVLAPIIGIDLLRIEPVGGAYFIQHNFLSHDLEKKIHEILFQLNSEHVIALDSEISEEKNLKIPENFSTALIVSDMLPNSSGDKTTDYLRFAELFDGILLFATKYLKKNGFLVTKVMRCGKESDIIKRYSKCFSSCRFFKPCSSYSSSAEIFAIFKKN